MLRRSSRLQKSLSRARATPSPASDTASPADTPTSATKPASRRKGTTEALSSQKAKPSPSPSITGSASISSSSSSSLPIHTFPSAAAWQSWLDANHAATPLGIWLQIAKKSVAARAPTVTYEEAIDAALCYGWIDGQRRGHSASHFLQRFTPRRKGSVWSQRNVDKVAALEAAGRMRDPGRAEVEAARADGRWALAYAGSSTIRVPEDFAAALEAAATATADGATGPAAAFFESLGKTQRYSFLWRIETAKKADTRQKRITQFVEMLGRGETFK